MPVRCCSQRLQKVAALIGLSDAQAAQVCAFVLQQDCASRQHHLRPSSQPSKVQDPHAHTIGPGRGAPGSSTQAYGSAGCPSGAGMMASNFTSHLHPVPLHPHTHASMRKFQTVRFHPMQLQPGTADGSTTGTSTPAAQSPQRPGWRVSPSQLLYTLQLTFIDSSEYNTQYNKGGHSASVSMHNSSITSVTTGVAGTGKANGVQPQCKGRFGRWLLRLERRCCRQSATVCVCSCTRCHQAVLPRGTLVTPAAMSACAGATSDVHALRSQLAAANERLIAVDSMTERVAALRCSLAAITAAANWGMYYRVLCELMACHKGQPSLCS
jgi:hypothetical protein